MKIKKDLHVMLSESINQIEQVTGSHIFKKTWIVESLEEKLAKDEVELSKNINLSSSK